MDVQVDVVENVFLSTLNSGKLLVLLSSCLIVKVLILFNPSRSLFVWVIVIFHFYKFGFERACNILGSVRNTAVQINPKCLQSLQKDFS